MKRTFLSAAIVFTLLLLAGCGDGHHHDHDHSPQIVTEIFSDPGSDGYIAFDPILGFAVTQGMTPPVQSVFAGIVPSTGEEFRAFLDFPLTGPDGVPGNAVIVSAVLDIFINSIDSVSGTVPIRIDLVDFPSRDLSEPLFGQPPLLSVTVSRPFVVDTYVTVDVTPLMQEAQRLGLLNFQIRILEDPGEPSAGLIEINDTTGANWNLFAPLLEVTYF